MLLEQHTRMMRTAARAVRPAERVTPGEWSERFVVLDTEQSPAKPGPFDSDWKPFTRAVHDLAYNEPDRRGIIAIKPSQIGFTRAMLNLLAYECDNNPGPFLYIISDKNQAAHFAASEFVPSVNGIAHLRESFDAGSKKGRETTVQRPYVGGRVDFAGAGSVSAVSSRPYVRIFCDEYEICVDNFPSERAGGLYGFLLGRTKAMPDVARLYIWSHPRRKGEGTHKLYDEQSDRRAWVFDCPHCGDTIRPAWSLVQFSSTDAEGQLDPDSASLVCPHCGEQVSDHDRASAVWPRELGGSGRFESELEPEAAARREYIGVAIHRLADPDVTVRSLAAEFVAARTDVDRMAFFNLALGEAFSIERGVVTDELVRERIDTIERIVVPGGPWGVQYLCAGVDVQAPKDHPTLYTWIAAFLGNGLELVVGLERLKGWAALHNLLRTLTVPVSTNAQLSGSVGVSLCSIDCGYATGEVLDFCRTSIVHADHGRPVHLLPMRYRPHIKADKWAIRPPETKRLKPGYEHLGPIELFDLHRNTCVSRMMARVREDERLRVLCREPGDFVSHMTSNVEVPVVDAHGWGDGELEWQRIKNRRDDWLQAGVYCEVGAALTLGLDRLYEIVTARQTQDRKPKRPASLGGPAGDWLQGDAEGWLTNGS